MKTTEQGHASEQFVGVAALLLSQAHGLNRDGFKEAALYVSWLGDAFRCASTCGCPTCLAEIDARKRSAQRELEKLGASLRC